MNWYRDELRPRTNRRELATMESRFRDHLGLSPNEARELAGLVTNHETLSQVLAWGASLSPPVMPASTVAQDEFSHDVVVPFERGRFLVYEVT